MTKQGYHDGSGVARSDVASGEDADKRRSTNERLTDEQERRLRAIARCHRTGTIDPSRCASCGQDWPCTTEISVRALDGLDFARAQSQQDGALIGGFAHDIERLTAERDETRGQRDYTERSLADVTRLLARIVACDGGHGSYGFDATIGYEAREKALDWIADVRPDWTAEQEWREARKGVTRG